MESGMAMVFFNEKTEFLMLEVFAMEKFLEKEKSYMKTKLLLGTLKKI
jgi:hypothetical protein